VPGKDRQAARARAKIERELAAKAAAKAARRRRVLVGLAATAGLALAVAAIVFVVNFLTGEDDSTPVAAKADRSRACRYERDTVRPAPRRVGLPPTDGVQRSGTRTATMTTNRGVLELELDAAKAPCTVNSFAFLAGKRFFDGTSCHRLSNQGLFVLQCGDPTGKGTGGPGYVFRDENLPPDDGYDEATLAMATRGRNANGSQFYVFFGDSPRLPPSYGVFGRVTKGLDVVKRVAAAGVNESLPGSEDGAPKQPVAITSMTVTPADG
jgi:peptidyl-prolyl cis-trans isomerase B (cyclophilin B)